MIVRDVGRGWQVITQPAHAWLAGKLAAAWGNEDFARPSPFEAVILATRLHDIGWLEWDASPRLGTDGRPVNFLDTTLSETIPIWRRAVQHMSLIDPYAAILVSKHASTIYRRRLERGVDPPDRVIGLLAEQEAVREALSLQLAAHPVYGAAVEADYLQMAYRWLRACDLLSLALCADEMPSSGVIKAVRGINPAEFIEIKYSRSRPFALQLEPWPFARTPLQLEIQTRFLSQTTYPNEAAFIDALKEAPWAPQTITVLNSRDARKSG